MASSKFTKFLTFLVVAIALFYLRPDARRFVLVPVFHAAYRAIDWVQEGYIAADPDIAWSLRGNFGPVPQQWPFTTDLKVSFGAIPQDIDGFCVKSGPNAAMPITGLYHWFDGDGMLHGLRLAQGRANYSNMQIETVKLQNERRLGWAATPKLGGLRGYSGLARMALWHFMLALDLADKPHSKGTANTASVYHHDALMALVEVESPFEIHVERDGQLRAGAARKQQQLRGESDETVDAKSYYNTFNGAWEHPFTAHPKVDPATGELIFFGYQVDKKPYCIYGLADKQGNLLVEFPVDIPEPVMMHDFAITEHYSIIMDLPLVFNPKMMIKGEMVFAYNSSRVGRFGIFPRHPKSASEIVWFEVPSCYVFHPVNAWEENGNIVMFASRFPDFTLTFNSQTKSDYLPYLYKWVFNLKTGKAEGVQSEVTEVVEFGRVNPAYLGRKTAFGYMGVIPSTGGMLFNGIAKVDLRENGRLLHKYIYPESTFGGEAVFVPKTRPTATYAQQQQEQRESAPPGEDDGYLVGFAHNEATAQSAFYIWEARDLSLVTVIDLPYRVPYGFHSTWVTGEEILKANA